MIRKLDYQQLDQLIHANDNPLVSMYAPMERAGREVRQNQIRWKNLIKDAESKQHSIQRANRG